MPATSMVIMDMDILAMPTMDTMDTHMPATMDITMARGPLMPSPLPLLSPRLMLMLSTDTTDTDTDLPTMDTDMARGPLMPSLPLMLPMDTMDMVITLAMPTMDTMDTHMLVVDTSTDKMDIIIKFLVTKI